MPGLGVRGSEAWRRAFTSLYYTTVNTSFAACGDCKICTGLPPSCSLWGLTHSLQSALLSLQTVEGLEVSTCRTVTRPVVTSSSGTSLPELRFYPFDPCTPRPLSSRCLCSLSQHPTQRLCMCPSQEHSASTRKTRVKLYLRPSQSYPLSSIPE